MIINKSNNKPRQRKMYMTRVLLCQGKIPWTVPRNNIERAQTSAQNMICNLFLSEEEKQEFNNDFNRKLNSYRPDLIEKSLQYIGQTIEVYVPSNMKPMEFRRDGMTKNN